jgi:hypothetical protein
LTASLHAQTAKTNFKGVITDESDLPVPGATIMILDEKDSTLIQFGASDAQGAFMIKNVERGFYILNVNFLAHEPFYQMIRAGVAEEVDLGVLKLEPENTVLNPVEVKADYIPVELNKDTIAYNADAFETQPNANVEDLLRNYRHRSEPDGSVKAQGEDVQKILADGKNSSVMILKWLPRIYRRMR